LIGPTELIRRPAQKCCWKFIGERQLKFHRAMFSVPCYRGAIRRRLHLAHAAYK
jgi:hypothetical protein